MCVTYTNEKGNFLMDKEKAAGNYQHDNTGDGLWTGVKRSKEKVLWGRESASRF